MRENQKIAKMIDVTDEKILLHSSGEITHVGDHEGKPGSLWDKRVFCPDGGISKTSMGHIHLPVPFVNVQYMTPSNPELQNMLGISSPELQMMALKNTSAIVELDQNTGRWKFVGLHGGIVNTTTENHPTRRKLHGIEAIELLLDGNKYKDRIILHNLPVLPIWERIPDPYHDPREKQDVQYLYENVLRKKKAYKKAMKREIESAYGNEILDHVEAFWALEDKRFQLQKAIGDMIDNGWNDDPIRDEYGIPYDSLEEYACQYMTPPHWDEFVAERTEMLKEILKDTFGSTFSTEAVYYMDEIVYKMINDVHQTYFPTVSGFHKEKLFSAGFAAVRKGRRKLFRGYENIPAFVTAIYRSMEFYYRKMIV